MSFLGKIWGILGEKPCFWVKNGGVVVGLYRLGKMGKKKTHKKSINLRKFL